jgi:hypothetical protein
MPKKSRRAKARRRAQVAKPVQEARPQQARPSAEVQGAPRVSPKAQVPKAQDLSSRYQYVVPELKRIGVIGGAIVVGLIILSFILG